MGKIYKCKNGAGNLISLMNAQDIIREQLQATFVFGI